MINQREIALKILDGFYIENKDLDYLINNNTKDLDPQARGFVQELVRGTVRYSIRLDYIIRKLSKRRFSRIDKSIVNILRMALYQILYMDHVPQHAAVDEAVNLSKKVSKRDSSFVNGMLRNFLRNKSKILDLSRVHYKDRLVIEYGFPEWIIEKVSESYDDVESVLAALNEDPAFEIRNNSLKGSRNQLIDDLKELGYTVSKIDYTADGITVEDPRGIFDTDLFASGRFYVQSGSSQLVTELADPKEGTDILDMAAAPGGKLTHMYQLTDGQSSITGVDINGDKLDLIKENLERLDMTDIDLKTWDSTEYNKDWENKYDLVMLDGPCSALGLIKRYPEMKHTKSLEDVKSLNKIQKQLIDNGSRYVKPGGKLIYSTCSILKEENENIIDELLADNSEYSLEKFVRTDPADGSDGFGIGVIVREPI